MSKTRIIENNEKETVNSKKPRKKSMSSKIWVKKRKSTVSDDVLENPFKVHKNPVTETKKELLKKLDAKLRDYFSCVPEDVRKMSVLKVLQILKASKTITVSIGDCSYIFDGEKVQSKDKFSDPRVKEIISVMVKKLRNL